MDSQVSSEGTDWPLGYVHVYTGDGKGKTTAAMGLALRAAGAGLRVCIIQFVKGMRYGEHAALASLSSHITLHLAGRDCFILHEPTQADMDAARAGLELARGAIQSGGYRVVILDEASIALHFGLFHVEDLVEIVTARPPQVEVVITGRRAPPELLAVADLVTEMREVKHYYQQGVLARLGIDK